MSAHSSTQCATMIRSKRRGTLPSVWQIPRAGAPRGCQFLRTKGASVKSAKSVDDLSVDRKRVFEWDDPTPFWHRAEGKSGLELLQLAIAGELPPPPMAMLMDIRLTEIIKGRAIFTGRPQEFHYPPLGSVHGGYGATLLD